MYYLIRFYIHIYIYMHAITKYILIFYVCITKIIIRLHFSKALRILHPPKKHSFRLSHAVFHGEF